MTSGRLSLIPSVTRHACFNFFQHEDQRVQICVAGAGVLTPAAQSVAIYELIDPTTQRIRYVGFTSNPATRLRMHIYARNKKRTHKNHWIQTLCAQGVIPIMRVVCWVQSFEEAERVEIALIAAFILRGEALTNETAGGNGGRPSGNAVREKLSIASKRNWDSKTPEEKAAHALSSKNRVPSTATRKKMSDALKIRWQNPDYQKHAADVMRGNTHLKGKKFPNSKKKRPYTRRWPTAETCEKRRQSFAITVNKKRAAELAAILQEIAALEGAQ